MLEVLQDALGLGKEVYTQWVEYGALLGLSTLLFGTVAIYKTKSVQSLSFLPKVMKWDTMSLWLKLSSICLVAFIASMLGSLGIGVSFVKAIPLAIEIAVGALGIRQVYKGITSPKKKKNV